MVGIGLSSIDTRMTDDVKEEIAWNKIQEVEEELDWDISEEVDDVRYDPNLSYKKGAEAETRAKPNGKTEIVFGDSFFDKGLSDYSKDIRQFRTTLHELLHVSDFSGRIEEDLDYLGAPDDFKEEWSRNPFYRPIEDTEALTEITVDELIDEDLPSAYPNWKRKKERELDRKGVETDFEGVESEDYGLIEEIEDLKDKVEDQYGSDPGVYSTEGLYVEKGENYSVTAIGDNAELYGSFVGEMARNQQDSVLDPGYIAELFDYISSNMPPDYEETIEGYDENLDLDYQEEIEGDYEEGRNQEYEEDIDNDDDLVEDGSVSMNEDGFDPSGTRAEV